jgi:hypothetical protein
MRFLLPLCAAIAMLAPFHMTYAGEPDADSSDIVILSVKPRSPDVKPIAMSVSANGHEAPATGRPEDKAQRIASGTDTSTRR